MGAALRIIAMRRRAWLRRAIVGRSRTIAISNRIAEGPLVDEAAAIVASLVFSP
jgi:hypothetical protein